jgi:hypothetical protein
MVGKKLVESVSMQLHPVEENLLLSTLFKLQGIVRGGFQSASTS